MTDQRKLLERALVQLRETRARLAAAERAAHEPISVLGAGVRLPGDVADLEAFWSLLRDGVDAVTPSVDTLDGHRPKPADRVENGRWAGLLTEVDGFDAGFFGIAPAEAAKMDPQQRLVLEVAWEAMEDAGLPLETLQRAGTGVFLGVYNSDYLTLQYGEPASINTYTAPGGAHSVLANRVSYLLNLRGPSLAVDTACSSSLMAVHLAVRALRHGECDIALAGGVNVILNPISTLVTEKVLPLAPGGRCRTFDAAADGIIRAEGCGVLVLTRESLAGGRRVRAVIRGTAANHDGRTNGLTAPNPRAQADLLRRALDDAGARPEEVTYIEAHGTGTPLGDPIEVEALREVYGDGTLPCALGSVKTNFGHQEAAAGVTGLIKAMLVLEHEQVPPNVHLRRLNPEIDLTGSRLSAPAALTGLARGEHAPMAAVSSFGFGGANAHAILQAPSAPPASIDAGAGAPTGTGAPAGRGGPTGIGVPAGRGTLGKLVLPLSARDPAALVPLARAYAERLVGCDTERAAAVCAAAGTRRTHLAHRLCLAATDPAELMARLGEVEGGGPAVPPRPPRVAFVFSGQGSQWAGMGTELLRREPVVAAEVAACDAVVRELAGWSVLEQLADGGRLHETEVAQVAIGALQLGLAALWRSWGIEPAAVTGHSMGEVTAACAAGALDRAQTFDLLLRRARRAEEGAAGGAMASIALPPDRVRALIDALGADRGRAGIGAVNGPRSTVVSGERQVVTAVCAAAERLGANVRRLPSRYGFHSPMLDGQDDLLAAELADLRPGPGTVPMYSTVTGALVQPGQLGAAHWGRNLRDAVRFSPAVSAIAATGVTVFVELGPHPVLLRDLGETLEEAGVRYRAVGTLRRDQPLSATLDRSLADLYRAGLDVDWEAVLGAAPADVALPAYPWQRRRHWLGEAPQRADLVTTVPLAERTGTIALFVRRRIADALGFDDLEQVPEDRPLADFALDSLVIVEMKGQAENELGVTVPLQALLRVMQGGTALDLAAMIAKES
ncbi:type I polyketide synthase [Nonomuraea gerenzanensis]|uniref:Malonyl CoA-acyl carrier protein transacylase n=1 Tax=Nonomuraea gerenzanensis TaxID=93944 RepID=A0A1M4E8P4_9ACTN|nr:type I polyketide synthase [Nonomuraea gerenzanensis]UBU17383.1 acyltransferase domain-containing protein [Nonomuraea gerenzanensis]SBO95134.1 Malonyl CoA-acyl carrier protein transacylase [Nonomuraea gerenzanensis]